MLAQDMEKREHPPHLFEGGLWGQQDWYESIFKRANKMKWWLCQQDWYESIFKRALMFN
jgi:hypothetical protein